MSGDRARPTRPRRCGVRRARRCVPGLVRTTDRLEDLVKLLDGIGGDLRRGRYPSGAHGKKVAEVLRKVADDFDA